MERKFNFSVEEFYHLYNRGNNKSNIFIDDTDRKRFQKLLYICNTTERVVFRDVQKLSLEKIKREDTLVDIGAYCLMPNHFHLLVREKKEGGISLFAEKLLTAYSMYFNKKSERTGKLFEGRFKATHVDSDRYLKYLFSYIHLNPVKLIDPRWKKDGIQNREEARSYLRGYLYSSYLDYFGEVRDEMVILNRDSFPDYFRSAKEFEEFVDEWLLFKNFE
jgi:putative transposase